MAKTIVNKTSLVECIVFNNRFATAKVKADQIGPEDFANWKELVADLHKGAYSIYVACENAGMEVDSKNIDMTPVFDPLKAILAQLGEINGRKIHANAELATLIVGYAGKRANSDSPELQLCISRIRNRTKELEEYENTNGVRPETIASLKAELETLEAQKSALLANPDNRIKAPTRTTPDAFRLEVEHRIARVIADQQAKTWDTIETELAAKRAERRAKNKAKRAAANANANN